MISNRRKSAGRIIPLPLRQYDLTKPAQVLSEKGAVLWEGPDILIALFKLRQLGGDKIVRDGVLLAKSAKFTKKEKLAYESLHGISNEGED